MLPRVLIGPLLALLLLACVAPAANAAEVPSEWNWTDFGPSLRDVSCASPGHCVAVGQRGMVLYSKHAGDDGLAWSRIPMIEFPQELDGVTCTTSFCLTVSNTREGSATFTSQVFRSTDGGATWSAGVALPPADAGPGGAKTRTAIALGAHRNTVLNRLRRAQELLPEPLAGRTVEVGLALELARWLGSTRPSG